MTGPAACRGSPVRRCGSGHITPYAFQVSPEIVYLVLGVGLLLASVLPARRATRVSPVEGLATA